MVNITAVAAVVIILMPVRAMVISLIEKIC